MAIQSANNPEMESPVEIAFRELNNELENLEKASEDLRVRLDSIIMSEESNPKPEAHTTSSVPLVQELQRI